MCLLYLCVWVRACVAHAVFLYVCTQILSMHESDRTPSVSGLASLLKILSFPRLLACSSAAQHPDHVFTSFVATSLLHRIV